MKIAVLSHANVAGYYAASLMARGHEVTIGEAQFMRLASRRTWNSTAACCFSDEPDLREIADYMEASGKKVWRHLSEIPGGPNPSEK